MKPLMQQSAETLDASNSNQNLTSALQQEVDFGVQALQRGNADMAVTFFQSALQKVNVHQPFYDHLVHNLLLSYKHLIEKLLKTGDIATAQNFLRAALRLEIRGEMADDSTFLQRFADEFQSLGLVFFQNILYEESLLCCRKAISLYARPGAYVNLTNALSAARRPAKLSDFTTAAGPAYFYCLRAEKRLDISQKSSREFDGLS